MMGQTVSMFTSTILPKKICVYENVATSLGYYHNSYTLYGLPIMADPVQMERTYKYKPQPSLRFILIMA
jgi:hypothetical protein